MENGQEKHLEFIQNIISRFNSNSFQIKNITVTIISALVVIYASSLDVYFILIGIMPVTIFWLLDAYYIQQEKKFRGLYDDVAKITSNVEVKRYEMPINNYRYGKYSYFFSVSYVKS